MNYNDTIYDIFDENLKIQEANQINQLTTKFFQNKIKVTQQMQELTPSEFQTPEDDAKMQK